MKLRAVYVLVTVCLAAVQIQAGENADGASAQPALVAQKPTVQEFLAFQEKLGVDLQDGKYGRISRKDMKLVEQSQATLRELLTGVTDIDQLTHEQRIELFNAQESVKSVLQENERDRVICRKESTVGTHRKVTRCYTVEEAEVMRRRTEEAMGMMTQSYALPASN